MAFQRDFLALTNCPEDFDHFQPILEAAVNRMPILAEAASTPFLMGPESFTPDDRYYLPRSTRGDGYWWRAATPLSGSCLSGGAGMALAHWHERWRSPFRFMEVDMPRAQPFPIRTRRYLQDA